MNKSVDEIGKKTAQVLSSTIIYNGPVFGIRRDEVIEPSGVRATREVITHPGSVVVLPVLPDGRIVLIRQFRYAAKQYLWELVTGQSAFECSWMFSRLRVSWRNACSSCSPWA